MQINITTDYAIRILLCLYLQGENSTISSSVIADKMGIPFNYMAKILKKLKNNNLIKVQRGQYGGYILGEKGENISLYDIMEIMEPEKINRCLEEDHFCSRNCYGNCPVCSFYSVVQEKWDASRKEMTLKVLASCIDELKIKGILKCIS